MIKLQEYLLQYTLNNMHNFDVISVNIQRLEFANSTQSAPSNVWWWIGTALILVVLRLGLGLQLFSNDFNVMFGWVNGFAVHYTFVYNTLATVANLLEPCYVFENSSQIVGFQKNFANRFSVSQFFMYTGISYSVAVIVVSNLHLAVVDFSLTLCDTIWQVLPSIVNSEPYLPATWRCEWNCETDESETNTAALVY